MSSSTPMDALPEKDEPTNFDLSSMNIDELFDENDTVRTITNEPIFELNGHIMFTSILQENVEVHDQHDASEGQGPIGRVSKLIAFYGVCSGIALTPLSLTSTKEGVPSTNVKNNSAGVKCIILDCSTLESKNQHHALLYCSKDIINQGSLDCRSPEIAANFSPHKMGVGPQENIKEKFEYYIKLSHELEYVVATCFVLGTYLFPLFSYFGYLIITGEKGAGKGTCLDLLYRMCWNPTKKYISATEAVLFRTIQDQRPTLLIDEYHRAIKNESSGNAIISILESGYEKDGVVPRMECGPDGTFKKMEYPVYCPKAVVTREPVEADDKGIKITVPKVTGDVLYSKRKIELEKDQFFEDVRIKIMKWMPYHDAEVLDAYTHIEPTYKLGGRDFQVWAPLLSIAKVAFPNRYDELFKFAEKSVATKRSDNNEKETVVLRSLYYLYARGKLQDGGNRVPRGESYKVTNKEIKNALIELEFDDLHHNAIKSALDNLRLVGKHENGYYLKKSKLITLFKERGLIKSDEPYENPNITDEDLRAKAANPDNPGSLEACENLAQIQFNQEQIKVEQVNYYDLNERELTELCGIHDEKALSEFERRHGEVKV